MKMSKCINCNHDTPHEAKRVHTFGEIDTKRFCEESYCSCLEFLGEEK